MDSGKISIILIGICMLGFVILMSLTGYLYGVENQEQKQFCQSIGYEDWKMEYQTKICYKIEDGKKEIYYFDWDDFEEWKELK